MEMNQRYETIRNIVRERKTTKVLGELQAPVEIDESVRQSCDQLVKSSIEDAGWAPFHYDRGADGVPEPWRVHWLDVQSCRNLAQGLSRWIPQLKPGSKLPALLSGCGSVALFNWLPQSSRSGKDGHPVGVEKLRRVNEEHLAATSAMVQNFLLLLTAAEIDTYWASGDLWQEHLFELLEISSAERNVAVIFVHYPIVGGKLDRIEGKLRSKRTPSGKWFRPVSYRTEN